MVCTLSRKSGHELDINRKREPQLRKCFHWLGPWASLGGIFWIANWQWRAQSTVGGATPGQVELSYVKKLTKQAKGSNTLSSIPPQCLLQFLSPPSFLASLIDGLLPVRWRNPFSSPQMVSVSIFHSNREQARTHPLLQVSMTRAQQQD